MRNLSAVAVLFMAIFFSSCSGDKEECVFIPETSSQKGAIEFEQFQDSMINIPSKKALVDLLTRQPQLRDHIFRRKEYPDDSIFINEIYRRFDNPHIDSLLIESKRVFGDMSNLRSQFEEAFTNIRYYYPDFVAPKVQTVISGLDTDLFISDSLIIVSVDFFLGPGAKYRPKMYDYLLRQYEKENIVPSCMLVYGIRDRFNKTDVSNNTVLADMIAYGKSFYFAKHMLPCVPDSIFIWYTPKEMEGSRRNQDLIWARLIQDEVLYATSHVVKQKYLSDRPKTLEVGDDCPGRIAQFVGWQIVNTYAKSHESIGLPALMKTADAGKIFRESNYRPERK